AAVPDGSSVFTGWQGGCSGQNCSLTMDSNKVVTATFAHSTYDLNLTVNGDGSDEAMVTSNPAAISCGSGNAACQQTFAYNTVVTLTASYDSSQMALVWGGACGSATGNRCMVTMKQLQNVTATFTRGLFALGTNIAGNGNGLVVSTPTGINCDQEGGSCSAAFTSGEAISLTATAGLESQFSGWSGLCSGTADCHITLNQTEQVTATFTLNQYELTVSKTGNGVGTVTSPLAGLDCGITCTQSLDYGTVVTLTANAGIESQFMGWLGACSGTAVCLVTVDQAKSVTAHFALNSYPLEAQNKGNGTGLITSSPAGIGCGVDCTELYPFGTVVTLTTTVNSGSIFNGWSGACVGSDSCVVTIDQAQVVTATFTLVTHTLTVNTAGTGTGSVTSQPAGIDCGGHCTAEYDHNMLVVLTATPQTGSSFTGWSGACSGTESCVVTMDQAQSVTAHFDLISTNTPTYTLAVTLKGDGAGTVTSDPAGIDCGAICTADYTENTLVMLTATPASGSNFVGWSGSCIGTDVCLITMSQAQTITAEFTSILIGNNEHTLFLPLVTQ
ncbi:MAG: hypothetical protein KDE51_26980, partial [Anaerolineales bacterium]|nr:hypothetical protein [Anaerolineales bacterium]